MANMLSPESPSRKIVVPIGYTVLRGAFLNSPNFRAVELTTISREGAVASVIPAAPLSRVGNGPRPRNVTDCSRRWRVRCEGGSNVDNPDTPPARSGVGKGQTPRREHGAQAPEGARRVL